MEKAQKKVANAQGAFDKADRAYASCAGKRRKINDRIQEIEQDMRELGRTDDVQALGDEYDRNEKLVRNLNAMIHQREINLTKLEQGVDATFVNKSLAVVEERSRALDGGKQAVEQTASELTMDQEALKVVQYWHKAFGPTGIPNMILADAVPILNRVAQRISSLMTGGTLQVSYSTTRQLVSGESRAQLVTRVVNHIGSSRIEGSSKGEGGLTNLIIAENLNEIGQVSNRVGFRWYDEVTSGQDAVVRRSIFAYLKEVAHRMGILIFVVDHHAEAASYADYVLIAEKTKEHGTTYTWH
jgi:DNA repair exonuclease SbcCD ATPase subunit